MEAYLVLSFLLLCLASDPAEALVRETFDAIIVEAADWKEGLDVQVREQRSAADSLPVLPGGTFLLPTNPYPLLNDRTCWTPDGKVGTCGTVRSCYPNVRLPLLSDLETWVVGTRGTCHYVEADGRNIYGLCCAKQAAAASPFWPFLAFPPNPVLPADSPAGTIEDDNASKVTAKPKCGAGPFKILSLDEQSRIVGGQEAVRHSWPFIASMQNNGRHFCGASLASATMVITAAHCVAHMDSFAVSKLEVVFGTHSVKPVDPHAVRMKVRRVTRHKGYNPRTMVNDIAILTLATPISFTERISPICLPAYECAELHTGKAAAVMGWGTLKEGGNTPAALQQVTVEVHPNSDCKKKYGKDYDIVPHMLCAASPGKDSCQGDSGGPLVIQLSSGGDWYQEGVVSWGIGCAQSKYPGVYVRLRCFIDWIGRNSKNKAG